MNLRLGEGALVGEGGCRAHGGDTAHKEPGQGTQKIHAGYTG